MSVTFQSNDEYIAKAMLLGLVYDDRDHTFFNEYGPMHLWDPDTMELLTSPGSGMWHDITSKRERLVAQGKLGCTHERPDQREG